MPIVSQQEVISPTISFSHKSYSHSVIQSNHNAIRFHTLMQDIELKLSWRCHYALVGQLMQDTIANFVCQHLLRSPTR